MIAFGISSRKRKMSGELPVKLVQLEIELQVLLQLPRNAPYRQYGVIDAARSSQSSRSGT